MNNTRLNLVVAICNNGGIGVNGNLPWKLKKDMDFFKKITSQTENPDKQNVVIMGRKTWFSIPEKFRPLKGRINIVLSRELKDLPEGVHLARSLPEALSWVNTEEIRDRIENIHIIGGSSVYKEAMTGPYPCRIYLTRVLKDFHCDTFLPEINEDTFHKIQNPADVPVELQEEDDVKFRFEVYEKNACFKEPIQTINVPYPQQKAEGKSQLPATSGEPIRFDVMAAMCHGNRGIGYKSHLPWPSLKKDYKYYTKKTSTFQFDKSDKKIIHIRGRHCWLECEEAERSIVPNVYHIIISKSLDITGSKSHDRILKVVPDFQSAISYIDGPPLCNEIDSVWVMGGSMVYKDAVNDPRCRFVFLTHVYTDFPADTFFPTFEDNFTEVRKHDEFGIVYEDAGIKYEFKVYHQKSLC